VNNCLDRSQWPAIWGDPISVPVLVPFLLAQKFWFRNYVLIHARNSRQSPTELAAVA
jgi:hypothetical protein